MPGHGETDWAARRAAIVTEGEARRAEIWAGFHGHVEALRDIAEIFEKELARGVPPMLLMLQAEAEPGGGRRPMTVKEAEARRDQLLREESKDRLCKFQALEVEMKIAGAETKRAEEPSGRDELVGGLPYKKADYEAAGKLHKAGKMTVTAIELRCKLSTKRAHRIHRQYRAEAVVYDDVGLHPGRGYMWDPAGLDQDPPGYKLIQA